MKLLEQHLVEKYEGKFTIEELVNEGIPKLFLKTLLLIDKYPQ